MNVKCLESCLIRISKSHPGKLETYAYREITPKKSSTRFSRALKKYHFTRLVTGTWDCSKSFPVRLKML